VTRKQAQEGKGFFTKEVVTANPSVPPFLHILEVCCLARHGPEYKVSTSGLHPLLCLVCHMSRDSYPTLSLITGEGLVSPATLLSITSGFQLSVPFLYC
jgi:hypothetical protein